MIDSSQYGALLKSRTSHARLLVHRSNQVTVSHCNDGLSNCVYI